ncbi:MAG: hypothetical protein GEU83_04930 [Pseudonocardiaceae bacterium]|nr:hypothetical protein [Pseudonocardiaceae bacterium]
MSFTAELVAALEGVWAAIQALHPDVPDVVVMLGSGTLGLRPGQVRLGQFEAGRWQRGEATDRVPELFIGGEGLRRGPGEVLATLLHEAAHGIAHVRGIKDTSRQGRYHNARYKALAVELGLVVAGGGSLGWTDTRVPPSTAQLYARPLAVLETTLVAFRHPEASGPGKKKSNNGTVARCSCSRQFRITRAVLDLGPISCGACGSQFEDTNPATPDLGADNGSDHA